MQELFIEMAIVFPARFVQKIGEFAVWEDLCLSAWSDSQSRTMERHQNSESVRKEATTLGLLIAGCLVVMLGMEAIKAIPRNPLEGVEGLNEEFVKLSKTHIPQAYAVHETEIKSYFMFMLRRLIPEMFHDMKKGYSCYLFKDEEGDSVLKVTAHVDGYKLQSVFIEMTPSSSTNLAIQYRRLMETILTTNIPMTLSTNRSGPLKVSMSNES